MMDKFNPPASTKIFIAGESEAGKSVAAWKYWLSAAPRRIVVDYTGEWHGEADRVVTSIAELADAMRDVAAAGRWTIVCELPMEILPDLVAWLMPDGHLERSPIVVVGGAAMLLDEVDIIAAPGDRTADVRNLWRRCRHIGLTLVATTQRPECISREVKASIKQAYIMSLVEPDALLYCEQLTRVPNLRTRLPAWTAEHPHGGVWVDLRRGAIRWVTDDGRWSAVERRGPAVVVEPEPVTEDADEPDETPGGAMPNGGGKTATPPGEEMEPDPAT